MDLTIKITVVILVTGVGFEPTHLKILRTERRFLSSPNGLNQSELHRFQYSFRLPQMASHANGSHGKPNYFPESDGKHFGWPHVEVMCTILRRLHHLFEDPRGARFTTP